MATSQASFHPDIFVRRRVLLASLSVALIVALIFISVGYHLASDIGKTLEKNVLSQYTLQIASELDNAESSSPTLTVFSTKSGTLRQSLRAAFINSGDGFQTILSEQDDTFDIQSVIRHENDEHYSRIDGDLVYLSRLDINGDELLVVWRSHILKRVLNKASSTLMLAAFITLLITLWSSIVVAALISKRIAKRNEELEQLAMHDDLTGLKNKPCLQAAFTHYIEQKIEVGQTIPHGSLLYIDLDRFKEINDTLGHDVGDVLLTMVSERLKKAAKDRGETFRLRSDEFAIWLDDVDMQTARDCAFEVLYSCRKPVKIGGQSLEIGASVGLVCYPNQGTDINSLLRCADIATLHAKKRRLGVQEYDASLADITKLSVTLRGQLHTAMQREEFQLYYQPKVDLKTQRIVGVEAVTRWHHPTEGEIAPSVFIELVEQSGIVHAFMRYILTAAVKQVVAWQKNGITLPIAINLSAYNLLDKAFIPFIRQVLDEHQCPPELLEFELTESATMLDITTSKQFMSELSLLGVKTAIDDFGTGMSSFAYLRDLNIHSVKIDKSFLTHVLSDRKDCKIVEAIIQLCQTLSIRVIAEGIESEEQAELLYSLGCDIGQGYFFGRPMLASDLAFT